MIITYTWLYSIDKNKFPCATPVGFVDHDHEVKEPLYSICVFTIRNRNTGVPVVYNENDRSAFFGIDDSVIVRGRILLNIPFDLTPEFDYKTRFIPFVYYSPEEFHRAYPWAKDWKELRPVIEVPCEDDFSIFIILETKLPHSLKEIKEFHILDSDIYFGLKAYEAPIPFVFKNGELDHLFNRNA